MKKILFLLMLAVMTLLASQSALAKGHGYSRHAHIKRSRHSSSVLVNPNDVNVRGYVKKNGKYVKSHHRTKPNSTKADNYSAQGNVNPYTGAVGAVDPSK